MKRLRLLWLSCLLCLLCTSCNKPTEEIATDDALQEVNQQQSVEQDSTNKEFTAELLSNASFYAKESDKVLNHYNSVDNFGYEDKIPILKNKIFCGFLQINKITKDRITDWADDEIKESGVGYAYYFNFKVSVLEGIPEGTKLRFNLTLEDSDGVQYGKPTNYLWTGFPDSYVYFESTNSGMVEVGLQPLTKDLPDDCRVVISILDDNNEAFEPIRLNKSILKNSIKGKEIVEDSTFVYKSINGMQFKITVLSATYDMHKLPDTEEFRPFVDIYYCISFLKGPTNGKEVSYFNRIDNSINTNFLFKAQTDVSETYLYENYPDALRFVNGSQYEMEKYTYGDDDKGINVNSFKMIYVNRLLDTDERPEFIRLMFEFPEEVSARTPSELQKFNGRGVVFQLKVTDGTSWR